MRDDRHVTFGYDSATGFSSSMSTQSGTAAEMLVLLRRQWKLYPVTSLMVIIALGLFTVSRLYWAWTWLPWRLSEWIPWASKNLGVFEACAPVARALRTVHGRDLGLVLEDFGALGLEQVWGGQVWRLLVSAFHHGFALHIGGNLLVLWLLGTIMEDRFPRWWYAAFCVASSVLTVAAEALAGQASVGLSGTGYAIFGFLTIVRLRDPMVQVWIPKTMVIAGIVSMVACIPITVLELLPVANIAHFSGFGYGLLAGMAVCSRRHRSAQVAFSLSHVLLVPLAMLTTAPTWADIYQDHQLRLEAHNAVDPGDRVAAIETLVKKYPDRTNLRVQLVSALVRDDRPNEALDCAVQGWTGDATEMQRLLLQQIEGLTQLAEPDRQVAAFEPLLTRNPERTDARIRLVIALVLADRRGDAWRLAVEGWDGTYSFPQQVLKRQLQNVWQLMPDADSRVAAEAVMDNVLGDKSEQLKEKLELCWLSVVSNARWAADRKKRDSRRTSEIDGGPRVDEQAPGSAELGERT